MEWNKEMVNEMSCDLCGCVVENDEYWLFMVDDVFWIVCKVDDCDE